MIYTHVAEANVLGVKSPLDDETFLKLIWPMTTRKDDVGAGGWITE